MKHHSHPTKRPPAERMRQRSRGGKGVNYLLASGSMLALVGMLIDMRQVIKFPSQKPSTVCEAIVQPQAVLSRSQLSQLLSVPERNSKEAVRAIVAEPYCSLPAVELRAGVSAEREAYPLEFDPKTWFVVLYENNEYAGYDFVFQQ
jgi:hypothetical protein